MPRKGTIKNMGKVQREMAAARKGRKASNAGATPPPPPAPNDAAPPVAHVAGDVGPGAKTADGPAPDATPKPTRRGRTSGKSPATATPPKPAKPTKPKRLSGLDAAALVLSEAKSPMSVAEVFKAIEERGLWRTDGKTPTATLYAAIIREIRAKKQDARFRKTDRGRFVHSGQEVD
jgi:hypothetical protein